MTAETLVQIKDLRVSFFLDEGTVNAVNGVNFSIKQGKTLGLVGESGCGKSVTAQAILRIIPNPGRITQGQIRLRCENPGANGDWVDLTGLEPNSAAIRRIRGKEIAMVFQEPMTSLSPLHTVGNQIIEVLRLHQALSKNDARDSAIDILQKVGIPNPRRRIDEYPFELSGGLRQRAMIAMALACRPRLLIADEPTTALDVTVQSQILSLLHDLQREFRMSILLITHDLGVIAQMAEEVVVMYLGDVVEQASVQALFDQPLHPYTRALLRSIPLIGAEQQRRLETIEGMVPDAFEKIRGCSFYARCKERDERVCAENREAKPELVEVAPNHRVACRKFVQTA
jgi:peptide/nickel transport system ATP-binding protein